MSAKSNTPIAPVTSPTSPASVVDSRKWVVPWWVAPMRDADLRAGLLTVAVASASYMGYDFWRDYTGQTTTDLVAFIVHYAAAWTFTLWIWASKGRWKKAEAPSPVWALRGMALVLWLMSAFALNRTMAVFQVATGWLSGMVVLTCVLLTGAAWFGQSQTDGEEIDDASRMMAGPALAGPIPVRIQQLWAMGLTMSGLLFVYMAIYLFPFYTISIPGLLVLGISVHSFVPLLIVLYVGQWLQTGWRQHEHLRPAIGLGVALPLVMLYGFLWQWQQVDRSARFITNSAQTRRDDELPNWVLLAQRLSPNWITDRWLHTGVVYTRFNGFDHLDFAPNFSTSTRLHDPLVVIASLVGPPLLPQESDRAKLVSTLFDARHQTTEHLWNGRNLRVTNILTQSRIWPHYRLSYTEKTLTIQNRSPRNSDSEEAVFTVHLPEGAVVSSLSLWVNGREQKGVLTTQAKADTAYRQVVNIESRVVPHDPSVVRWLEGNRVLVRVFPCSPGSDRQVKIGVTAPLRAEGNELVYENPFFEGPDARSATETIQLDFTQMPTFTHRPYFLVPHLWETSNNCRLRAETNYQPDWSVRFKTPALATAGFTIDGQTYTLVSATSAVEPFSPTAVYLDLNASWSEAEVQAVQQAVGHRPVWVYDEGLVQLTPDNQADIIGRLRGDRFSLFPVFRINDPAHALLITKNTNPGPNLDDLTGSHFAEHLSQYALRANGQVGLRTFCLSAPAPMVAGLIELRVLQPAYGSVIDLQQLLTNQTFVSPDEPNRVRLAATGTQLTQLPATVHPPKSISPAPDHLYRLFAYNNLMRQVGGYYFDRNRLTDKLIHEAEAAHVVTPVSGLIVLETQKDYDRFGIKRDQHGLANATLKSEGAVPEPHEWAMIALLAVLLMGLFFRQRYVRA